VLMNPTPAGLIGAARLVPSWVFQRVLSAILAVYVGGRPPPQPMSWWIVELNLKRAPDLSKAVVLKFPVAARR